jgi:hypothetical protein
MKSPILAPVPPKTVETHSARPAPHDFYTAKALGDVHAERSRQVTEEGWTSDHDDRHTKGEMAKAAACYASFAALTDRTRAEELYAPGSVFTAWPWQSHWWKPSDRRRDLVKAGALILAEIERLDRAAERVRDNG